MKLNAELYNQPISERGSCLQAGGNQQAGCVIIDIGGACMGGESVGHFAHIVDVRIAEAPYASVGR